jgi:hypothetical protein
MKQPNIGIGYFVLRSALKGLWRSAISVLIATWIMNVLFWLTVIGFSSDYFGIVGKNNFLEVAGNTLIGVVYFIYISGVTSIISFWILGIPSMILPSISSSTILSTWLYQDAKKSILSITKARVKGAVIGCLAGISTLFILYKFSDGLSFFLSLIHGNNASLFFWKILFMIVPGIAAITGDLSGKNLAKELEPQGDYFSIDWEALQKEQQENNLTPDT